MAVVGIVGGATEIYISFDCCLMEMPKFTALFTKMPFPNDKCQFSFGANLYQRILIFLILILILLLFFLGVCVWSKSICHGDVSHVIMTNKLKTC